MKTIFDHKYLTNTLKEIDWKFAELEKWSVYNGDKGLDMIKQLRTDFEEVEKALYEK